MGGYMDFLKQYLKIINYSIIGIVFAFSSFYMLANLYHYFELRRDYTVSVKKLPVINNINNNLNLINKNINTFNANTYKGKISTTLMIKINQNLKTCVDSINNDSYKEILTKDKVSIVDVYYLREAYENNILNNCLVNNISWLVSKENNINSTYLNTNKELLTKHINLLLIDTSYMKKDLLNNSSYFYNTNVASSSVKDNTKDGLYEVLDAYNSATDFILYISNWYKMEVEG